MKKALLVIFLTLASFESFATCYSAFYSDAGVTAGYLTTPRKADCKVLVDEEYYHMEFTRNLLGLDMFLTARGDESILRYPNDESNGSYGLLTSDSIETMNYFIAQKINAIQSTGRRVIRITL